MWIVSAFVCVKSVVFSKCKGIWPVNGLLSGMRASCSASVDFPFFCHISWKQDSAPLQLHGSRARKERQDESTSHLLSRCWRQHHSPQLQGGRPHYIVGAWSQGRLALWGEWEDKTVSVLAAWGSRFCGGSFLQPRPSACTVAPWQFSPCITV